MIVEIILLLDLEELVWGSIIIGFIVQDAFKDIIRGIDIMLHGKKELIFDNFEKKKYNNEFL